MESRSSGHIYFTVNPSDLKATITLPEPTIPLELQKAISEHLDIDINTVELSPIGTNDEFGELLLSQMFLGYGNWKLEEV